MVEVLGKDTLEVDYLYKYKTSNKFVMSGIIPALCIERLDITFSLTLVGLENISSTSL